MHQSTTGPGLEDGINAFRLFVAEAAPLVVNDLKSRIDLIASRATSLAPWLLAYDIFQSAGLAGDEDAYTELIAWVLRSDMHSGSALRRQQTWLARLGFGFAQALKIGAVPRTQFITENGRVDLILDYSAHGHLVIVEAKTWSEEHEIRTGLAQTIGYVDEIRRKLNLQETDVQIHVIYLTPSCSAAANAEARCTSFVEFVLAMVAEIEENSPLEPERAGYQVLFTHLLNCVPPDGLEVASLVKRIAGWSSRPDWKGDEFVRSRSKDLWLAQKAFLPEIIHGK